MENSLNLRDLRGKGELELEIPGFDGYTIDTNLVCRSYKRGKARELKLNSKSYFLSRSNQMYTFRPAKLLYCAQKGIDPAQIDTSKFLITKDGEVMDKKEFEARMGLTDRNCLPNKGHKTKTSALDRLNDLREGLVAQRKSILTDDPKYIYDYLEKNKKKIINMTAYSLMKAYFAKELKSRYQELAMIVADHWVKHKIVKASLMVSAQGAMVRLIKEEREHFNKAVYDNVEYSMTDEGMFHLGINNKE